MDFCITAQTKGCILTYQCEADIEKIRPIALDPEVRSYYNISKYIGMAFNETWYFSVVDIIAALIQQPNDQTARNYLNKLKERLKKEGCESVTDCHQLKMQDGARQLIDII